MTDKLPSNLLALFAPRPALRYLPPSDHAQEERRTTNIGGVADFLQAFKEYEDDYEPTESWLQKRDRINMEKKEASQRLLTDDIKEYKPADDPNVRGDAFKTLFVSRLSYDTEVKDLEREFGRFGPIERVIKCRRPTGTATRLTWRDLRYALSPTHTRTRTRPRRRRTEVMHLSCTNVRRT